MAKFYIVLNLRTSYCVGDFSINLKSWKLYRFFRKSLGLKKYEAELLLESNLDIIC